MKNANTWAWLSITIVLAIAGSVYLSRRFGRTMRAAGNQSSALLGGGGGGQSEGETFVSSPATTQAGDPSPGSTVATGTQAKTPARAGLVVPAEAALDPKARNITTYRPGVAGLGAFEAAVANGSIPASYNDVLGDFSGRYRTTVPKPVNGAALGFQLATERAALPPVGGTVNVRIAIRSSDTTPPRAPVSLHLVIDVSGSMRGDAIENAKTAAATLVEKLQPTDDFSVVTFASEAKVLIPDAPAGAKRTAALETIKSIVAGGGTNISAGLDRGYGEARSKTINADATKVVMLLSHGPATSGDTALPKLWALTERAFQDGIQTSAFGIGGAFDAPLLIGIADKGAGGYYGLADSAQIAGAMGRELDARLAPAAQDVEVRVRLKSDVTLVKVFGSHMLDAGPAGQVVADAGAKTDTLLPDGGSADESGTRFFMPSFAKDDHHAIVLTLKVPAELEETAIATVVVRYKDRLRKKAVTEEIPLKIKFATSDVESAKTVNASVAATVQTFAAGETVLDVARHVGAGHPRAAAAAALSERAQLLKAASVELNEPRLNEDFLRIVRLADAVEGVMQVSDPLPLSLLLRGSGYGYLR
jgi:Ca-activated chloride channel family protein